MCFANVERVLKITRKQKFEFTVNFYPAEFVMFIRSHLFIMIFYLPVIRDIALGEVTHFSKLFLHKHT